MKHVTSAILILAALAGCAGPSDASAPLFQLGEPHYAQLAGETEYLDPVSGVTLLFAEGGQGELVTAEILDAPQRPFAGGRGWYIDYKGPGAVRARLPVAEGEEPGLYAHGVHPGAIDDGLDAHSRWVPVAGDSLDAPVEFELPLADGDGGSLAPLKPILLSAAAPSRGTDHRGFEYFWINRLTPEATDASRRTAVRAERMASVGHWLEALPEPLRTRAQQEIDGRLALRQFDDGNYYIGFTRRPALGNSTTPMIGLQLNADATTVAHEVGHYMTHVLAGDEAYLTIENLAPDENHGLGVIHAGRTTVTEDYAYFSEFFLTGAVGSGDPTLPRTVLHGVDPAADDLPSAEGFGAVLLASLVRSKPTTIGLVSKVDEPVPVVGASFGEVLALYAAGASTIDALREEVERFLGSRGESGKLPAMAERLGWTYRVRGRLIDEMGLPLSGAKIDAVSRVGSTEYGMGANNQARSDSDGYFQLARAFPGSALLTVEAAGQTTELPVTVAWGEPTNKVVNLGDLYVGEVQLGSFVYCSAEFHFVPEFVGDDPGYSFHIEVNPRASGNWSGLSFHQEWSDNLHADVFEEGSLTLRAGSNGTVLSSVEGFAQMRYAAEDRLPIEFHQLDAHDLPLLERKPNEIIFGVTGPEACEHISTAKRSATAGSVTYAISGFGCDINSALTVSCVSD